MSKVIIPVFRTAFNYDTNAASSESALFCPPEEGMTHQEFGEECDINTIVRRFGLTGELPENPRPPMLGDFTGVTDFQSAMQAVRAAEEGFMEFPAELRAEFLNDPQRMVTFLADENNRSKAIEMGLVLKPPEVTRDAVTAIDDLAKLLTPKPAV